MTMTLMRVFLSAILAVGARSILAAMVLIKAFFRGELSHAGL
jgi:hypothetical protein